MIRLTTLLVTFSLIALWQCGGPPPEEGDACNNKPRDQVICQNNEFILYCKQGVFKPVDFAFVPAEDGCTYKCSKPNGEATYSLSCP